MAIHSNNIITKDLFNNDPTFWDDDPAECNCGSYALNIVEWYYPYEDRETRDNWIESMLENGFTVEEAREEVFAEDVYNMETQFGDYLVPIDSPDNIPNEVEVIAYRVSLTYDPWDNIYYDFHFKVRRGGYWSEKCGMDEVRPCALQADETWDNGDCLQYSSTIQYFAINPFAYKEVS